MKGLKRNIFQILFILGILYIIFQKKHVEGFKIKECKFAILAIFKNEAMGIVEWIEHYLWQGADLIILLDNNSTDNYRQKIQHFKNVIVLPATENFAQDKHYSTIGLNALKENNVDIFAVVDLDEFMFSKDGRPLKNALIDIFNMNDTISSIVCRWTMFGSSNYLKQPESIRKSFTWKQSELHNHVKSVYILNQIYSTISIHSSIVIGNTIDASNLLQLNHYPIQSKEYFELVKMTRGSATRANQVNLRNLDYFNQYDFHEEEDTLLKLYVENKDRIGYE